MKKLLLLSAFVLSCGSSQPMMEPPIAPQPVEPPVVVTPEPEPVATINWLDPAEAEAPMMVNCFVIKFYSNDHIENYVVDQLLSDEAVVEKINSSYIPVQWDDDFRSRNDLGFGIDADFAGVLIMPMMDPELPEGSIVPGVLIEVDTDTGPSLPSGTAESVLEILNRYDCNGIFDINDWCGTEFTCSGLECGSGE